MIDVDNLTKRFGARIAVDGVSFTAADGQITGLLGGNGAGKTTTLRMLYALLRPDAGRVRIDGIEVGAAPLAARARLGVLPDARGLYKNLTARENIEYYARLNGLTREAASARATEMLRLLNMGTLAERRTEGFSQGERVKTALARALVHDPRNLLLDEPSNGLDVLATRDLRAVLRGFRDEGRCVLFSTHIMQEVAALCDRILIIAGGRLVASGTPDEIRARAGQRELEEAYVSIVAQAQARADQADAGGSA